MRISGKYFSGSTTLVIVCVILSLLNYGCTSSEEKVSKHFSNGMDYIAQQNFEAASIELKNVVQTNPKHAEARYQLGLVHLKLKDPQEAFKQLKIAADLDPDNTDAMLKVAEMLYLGKQYKESREKVDSVLALDAANVNALVLQANLEAADGKHTSALKAIDKAIEIEGENDRLLLMRGRIYFASGELQKAESSFQKAMQLKDDRIETHLALAELYMKQGKKDQAAKQMEQMVSIMDDSSQAFLIRAGFYEKTRDFKKALASLKQVTQLEPENARYHVVLGDFYRRMRDYDNADAAYEAATKLAEAPAVILARQAELAFETGRFDKARSKVEAALEADSRDPETKMVNARLNIIDQEHVAALEILEQVIKDYPNSGKAHYLKAVAYSVMGKYDLALKAGLEAIKHAPMYGEAMTLMAGLYLRKGDVKEAKLQAGGALQLDPTNLKAAMLFGRCLIAEKEYEKALQLFTEIRKKAPRNPEAAHVVGLIYASTEKSGKAIKAFENALELAPQSLMVLKSLVALHIKNGDKKKALAKVKQVSGQFSDNGGYHVLLGRLYEMSDGLEQAEKNYRKAITLDPQTPAPYMFLASILIKTGKKNEALNEYKTVVKNNPHLAAARMQIAVLLEAEGKYKDAAEQYKEILAINPSFVPAANNLAWYLAEHTEDLGEALRLALVARSGAPDNPNIADTVGWIHYKRGSHDLAMSSFRQAVKELSDNPTVFYHLGLAQAASGKKDAAVESLKKSLALNKDFPEKLQAVAKLDELQ